MSNPILVGYEIGTGAPVEIHPAHLIVTGLTQKSGKTTTLEALINRSQIRAIVFKTKPGEGSFANGQMTPAYLRERSDWEYVQSLLEATMQERMRFERSWIITACKGATSLSEVHQNIVGRLQDPKVQGINRGVFTTLDAYFRKLLPEISIRPLSNTLTLQPGINIMDLEKFSDQLQSLVIRSVLETILKEFKDVTVIMPEVWKFMPQDRGNPVKQIAEEFIRQGAGNGNFLWFDSQDITGVDKTPLKQVATWILGLQSETNEVKRTLAQMPIPKRLRPPEDEIMTLKKGQFIVCTQEFVKKVYVRPAWLDESTAVMVSKGETDVATLRRPAVLDLPPMPVAIPPTPRGVVDVEGIRKELNEVRTDFSRQIADVLDYVKKLAERITQQPAAATVDEATIVAKVLQKIPAPVPVTLEQKPVDMNEIIQAVIAKLPKNGSTTYTVAPLEALKKQVQREAKEKVMEQIRTLDDNQKKLLKFIEAAGKGVEHGKVCEICFGWAASGPASTKVKDAALSLRDKGFVKRDDKARTFPLLNFRIAELLTPVGGTQEDVDQVYNHIIAELLN